MPTVKQIRAELNQLTRDGVELLEDLTEGLHAAEDKKKSPGKKSQRKFSLLRFAAKYQQWYSAALPLVHQLLPDRYEEFQQCYRNEKRKQLTWSTYTISDYLRNNTPMAISNPETIAYMQLTTQLDIVDSAEQRLDSRLADIKGVLQAELFDDELSAASDLAKKGHIRAAGAVAGVVLERHLAKVAADHNVTIRKAHPSIGDLNDSLKNADVYDVPTWRKIQHLADIRNVCDHSKGRDPSRDEVEDLIRGADWVAKNIF
jgi:hypothetical protein